MSGKALFPLSISLAAKLSREFDGKLRIAHSGGADYYNIDKITACGIWPVTVATTLLQTGRIPEIYPDGRKGNGWKCVSVDNRCGGLNACY